MMKIGTTIQPDWLAHPADFVFLKQIGVDCVDITMDICPGFIQSGGRLNREGLERLVEIVDRAGLKVERANALNTYLEAVYLDKEGADQEIDNLVYNIELCGEFKFPVVGIQCFEANQLAGFRETNYHWVEGRGGYRNLKVELSDLLDRPAPPGVPTHEGLWERTIRIYRAAIPVAEQFNIKIAMHGNDPPVPSLSGVPQILYDFATFDRLFKEVPSANCGMTFCVGTRYESGEDVLKGIKKFGGQDRIFHVHFRNVQGRIPELKEYQEVIPDTGDLNMARVARALHEVGYEGVIDHDHIMKLTTDGTAGREYIAYCVGHMRGILQSLEDRR